MVSLARLHLLCAEDPATPSQLRHRDSSEEPWRHRRNTTPSKVSAVPERQTQSAATGQTAAGVLLQELHAVNYAALAACATQGGPFCFHGHIHSAHAACGCCGRCRFCETLNRGRHGVWSHALPDKHHAWQQVVNLHQAHPLDQLTGPPMHGRWLRPGVAPTRPTSTVLHGSRWWARVWPCSPLCTPLMGSSQTWTPQGPRAPAAPAASTRRSMCRTWSLRCVWLPWCLG